jgi:hypothetical protein
MAERKKRTLALELTTSNQDIYTVPTRFTTDVNSIYINNASNSSVTFSLDWYDAASTTYYTLAETVELPATLAETVELPANSLLQITDYPLYLIGGDKLRGLASANSSVNISISLEEFFETSL